jgi:hypothetical protein
MTLPVLVLAILAMGLQSPQELESRLRQKEQEVDRLTSDLRGDRQRVEELREVVAAQSAELRRPSCSAELTFVSASDSVTVRADGTVPLFLRSAVSRPDDCLNAEVNISASYLDASENAICSGVIRNVAIQSSNIQYINMLIRPWNMDEFVRWRNAPTNVSPVFRRLTCTDIDGLTEVNGTDAVGHVRSVRVRVTVLPQAGGIASVERTFRLPIQSD